MQLRPILPSLLALAAAVLLTPAAQSQELGAKIKQMFEQADQGALAKVWSVGRRISDLGEKEETVVRAIESQISGAGDHARLAAAAALQELTEGTEFGKEIFAVLKPVLQSNRADSVTAALSLAGRDAYFSRAILPDLRKIIRPKVVSDLTQPDVRIAGAKALWRLGTTKERMEAKKVMNDFVGASDRKLQIMGALALADINAGTESKGWSILQEIADEPTPEGQLARVHLRIENQRRTFDAMLQQVAKLGDERTTGKNGGGRDRELDLIREIIRRAASRHVRGDKITKKKMIENAARGLLRSLDPHSAFFTSDEFQKFYFDLDREYGGIGAFVNFDKDNIFSIVRPIYSGPAYEANLRSGDKILEVDGWETMKHTSDEIIAKLKGKPGSDVKIKVFRSGWGAPKEFQITRRKIQVPSVNHEMLPGDVGYVEVLTFGGGTSAELLTALIDLKNRGAKGLVLDLRNNTGGYLQIAKEVVELFVRGRKLVVYTKGRVRPREDYKTENRAIMPNMPMAVLINEYSASASEITAGALQDHGRALAIGKRSYGKGSVQSLLPLLTNPPERYKDVNKNNKHDAWEPYTDRNENGKYDIGPRLKLTMAYYYLPSGRCVQKEYDEKGKVRDPDWGVTPDREIDLREVSVRDRWKEAVLFDLIEKNAFEGYVKKHLTANKALFVELAEGDGGDVKRYPGFEEFYKGLDTKLPRDDVRRWLRYTIRDEVSDFRGKAFPGGRAVGDYQEDAQLQEGIRVVLDKLKQDIRKIAAYKDVLKISFQKKKTKKVGKK